MTLASEDTPTPSPWLSVWFRPGDTIERVLATGRRRDLVLLAGLGAASQWVSTIIDEGGLTTALLDWRFLLGAAVVATAFGIVNLYVNAVLLSWVGRIFRGHATPAQMRAVFAWGMAPLGVALVIYLAVIAGLKLIPSGNISDSASAAVVPGLGIVAALMVVWTFGMWMIMLKRVQTFGWWRAIFNLAIGSFFAALLVTLPIRAFLFQPFSIPAGSMAPTLLIGDKMLVSKYAYGYSRYSLCGYAGGCASLPSLQPSFSGRVFPLEPKRGDVVVFRLPTDDSVDYVKRIVGLPGDSIQMIDGVIHINGMAVKRERVEDFVVPETGDKVRRWRETLPNGVSYFALDLMDNDFLDNTPVYNVPASHYFVLGDNLDMFDRQPRAEPSRIRAVRKSRRACRVHLFLNRSPLRQEATRHSLRAYWHGDPIIDNRLLAHIGRLCPVWRRS
jgi:signal peptidase I